MPAGSSTGFGTADRWISSGQIAPPRGQLLTGYRAQRNGRALLLGLDGASAIATPVAIIQWLGNSDVSVTPGNLDFRVATSSTNATPTQVFRLKADGSALLGTTDPPSGGSPGNLVSYLLNINSNASFGGGINSYVTNTTTFSGYPTIGISSTASRANGSTIGIVSTASTSSSSSCYGVYSEVTGGGGTTVGLYGSTGATTSGIRYGVWGQAPAATNSFAGYFSGNVFIGGNLTLASDRKLKKNVKTESDAISKIMQLNPVNYLFTEASQKDLKTSDKFQHGFIAQELEKVFPEMVAEVSTPIYEEEGSATNMKISRMESFKSINYIMLIPLLTKAIQQQQQVIEAQNQRIANLENTQQFSKVTGSGYTLSQNVPNPFSDRTVINFQLPPATLNALLGVYDLTGKMLLQYNLAKAGNQVTINGSALPAGIYIYSLIVNGSEVLSKRMVLTK